MPAHPFARFDPLAAAVLLEAAKSFAPTLVFLLAATIGAVVGSWRRRRRSVLARQLVARLDRRRRRVSALAVGRSGLWALPLLVWALQTSQGTFTRWFAWNHVTRAAMLDSLFVAGLVLGIVVVVQSLAVLALSGPGGPRLGIGGGLRTGVRFALATVFLDGLLLACFLPIRY